ncbi:MAG: hypothetical protein ACTH2Q_12190 [Propionibacteriaceae bacterium]
MRWTADVAQGEWLREQLVESWEGLHFLVPQGYPEYVRVFHPFERERVPGRDWAEVERDQLRGIEVGELVTEQVGWAEVAERFGTTMHPQAQSHRLLRIEFDSNEPVVDDHGWGYVQPSEGYLDTGLLSRLAGVLADQTVTPDRGWIGVWEGWGGLTSAAGRASYIAVSGDHLRARLLRRTLSIRYRVRSWWRERHEPRTGSGVLPRKVAAGPRLELPWRDYILFEGGIDLFATADWIRRAPWLAPEDRASPQSPTLLWPADRAWFLVSEIDFDSTVIAGPRGLGAALAAAGIEALPIDPDADLGHEGDAVN